MIEGSGAENNGYSTVEVRRRRHDHPDRLPQAEGLRVEVRADVSVGRLRSFDPEAFDIEAINQDLGRAVTTVEGDRPRNDQRQAGESRGQADPGDVRVLERGVEEVRNQPRRRMK